MKQKILKCLPYSWKIRLFRFQKDKKTFLEYYNETLHSCFSQNLNLMMCLSDKEQARYLNELFTMREIAERKEAGEPFEELNRKFLKGWVISFPTWRDLIFLPSHID